MKQPFPFHPFEDSLTGNILKDYFEGKGKLEELISIFNSLKNNHPDFYFTPRVEKQTIMDTYPIKLRLYIKNNESIQIIGLLKDLVITPKYPNLDVLLELLEWFVLGFQEREMQLIVFNGIFQTSLEFTNDFIEYYLLRYDQLLKEPQDHQLDSTK
jgi:hypothetical protein